MKVYIQCESMGSRCGIFTYADRLNRYLNKEGTVVSKMFKDNIRNSPDIINIQYEPGLMPIQKLQHILRKYTQPVVVTAHHIGQLPQIYPMVDGIILHSEDQIINKSITPLDYTVIPHPALVFPKKDKIELRRKYGLPEDKKIVGTAGFICGTGKQLSDMIKPLINGITDDEFLYFITSFWKGGDMGEMTRINSFVDKSSKKGNFRIDTDFVSDEDLNEKMQCCDLLFAWNNMNHGTHGGSQSGIASDMYGSRVKTIVKNGPHYSYIASMPKVVIGHPESNEFVEDVFKTLRNEDLSDVQDPSNLSWEMKVKDYIDYFKVFVE